MKLKYTHGCTKRIFATIEEAKKDAIGTGTRAYEAEPMRWIEVPDIQMHGTYRGEAPVDEIKTVRGMK